MKEIIATDRAPKAIGPYSQATRHDGLIYSSGQIPLDPVTGQLIEGGIVEQPVHVACGKQDFESDELHFYSSVEECLAAHRPDVLLLSAVLHYLPKPYDTLRALVQWGIPSIIIDCTPLLAGDRDRLTVQHVPATIYAASYPAWFLSQTKLTGVILAAGYRLLADFEAAKLPSPPGEKACCKGFIFEKKSAHD